MTTTSSTTGTTNTATNANLTLGTNATNAEIATVVNALGDRIRSRHSDFPPNGTWVDSAAHQTYRSEFEFRRYAPKFNPNLDTFSRFYDDFEGVSRSFPCTLEGYKSVLHQSLIGSAKGIALNFAPHRVPYDTMTKDEYVKSLRDLFEPVDKVPALYRLYSMRKQFPKETLVSYFQHKLALFNAVVPYEDCKEYNWIQFYDQCINGLLNLRVRKELRQIMTQQKFSYSNSAEHDKVFRDCLRSIETNMHAEYRNGEISEADMVGVPAQMNLSLVNPTILDQTLIPHSSINALDSRIRCWGCGQPGHRMADCPKKPQSDSTSSNTRVHEIAEPVGYDDDFEYYEIEEEEPEGEINAFRRKSNLRRFRVPRGKGRGRFYRGNYKPLRRPLRGGYRSVSYINPEGEPVNLDVPEEQVGDLVASLQDQSLRDNDPKVAIAPPPSDLTASAHFLGEDMTVPPPKE